MYTMPVRMRIEWRPSAYMCAMPMCPPVLNMQSMISVGMYLPLHVVMGLSNVAMHELLQQDFTGFVCGGMLLE